MGYAAWGVHSGWDFVDGNKVSMWTPVNLVSAQWPGMWVRV